jgi:hypothetical protein
VGASASNQRIAQVNFFIMITKDIGTAQDKKKKATVILLLLPTYLGLVM